MFNIQPVCPVYEGSCELAAAVLKNQVARTVQQQQQQLGLPLDQLPTRLGYSSSRTDVSIAKQNVTFRHSVTHRNTVNRKTHLPPATYLAVNISFSSSLLSVFPDVI